MEKITLAKDGSILPKYSIKLALWGMGAAGRARLAATVEVGGLELAGMISRRPGVATLPLQEALADPSVDALAISLESTAHEDAVRQGLEAGKNILVDYPLALTQSAGGALFQLARDRKKLLHVEHIGLLTEEHLHLKNEVKGKGPLQKGKYVFQAGFNEKISDRSRTGPLPLLALPRLLQVADLWGMPSVEGCRFEKNEKGFSLHLHLRFADGGVLEFTEEHRMGLQRRRSLEAQGQAGLIHWTTGTGGGGLFAKDLQWFVDRFHHKRDCYYDERVMLKLIGLLEQVQ